MGVFSDGEEGERKEADYPTYKGEGRECPACGRTFVPGDMVNVFTTPAGEVAVCHLDHQSFRAQFEEAGSCVRAWRKKQSRKYPAPIVMTISAE